jgi:hypothetical protein
VLCCAVLCCAVLCCAVLCCAVLCCAVLCCPCCAVLCCAVLCCAVLCCAVLCCAVLCYQSAKRGYWRGAVHNTRLQFYQCTPDPGLCCPSNNCTAYPGEVSDKERCGVYRVSVLRER